MDSITSFLEANILARIVIVAGPIIGLVLLVRWRANSLHSILERVWRIAAGKAEPHNDELKQLLQETRDMERFRFLYRIKLKTVADIARFRAWRDEHKVGIFEARQIARWLDLGKDEILLPPPRHYGRRYRFLAMLCLPFLFLGYLGVITHHGWFQTKATKVSFLMDKNSVRSPFYPFSEQEVPLESCNQGIEGLKHVFAFSDSEATAICRSYAEKSIEKSVADAVRFQLLVGALLMLYSMPPLFFAFVRMNSANVAVNIAKRIVEAKHSASP